jgi:hypothetical protein
VKVSQHRDRLTRAGATAVFVVHDQPELLRRTMLAGVTSPFPVVVDMDRTSYRAWGLRRTSAVRIWLDPNVWLQYAHLLRSGERLRQMGRDTRQLGGTSSSMLPGASRTRGPNTATTVLPSDACCSASSR